MIERGLSKACTEDARTLVKLMMIDTERSSKQFKGIKHSYIKHH